MIANIFTALAAFATTVGVVVLIYQIKDNQKQNFRQIEESQKQNRLRFALDIYRDYLKIALQYPELSSAKYDEADEVASDKYDTFVSMMLFSFDEVLKHSPEYILPAIKYEIKIHQKYLRDILSEDSEGDFRENYSPELMAIIDETLK